MKQLFFVITICTLVVPVFSNDEYLIVAKGTSKLTDLASARRAIYQEVTKTKTLEIIEDLLGQKEFSENQKLISENVLSKKDHFILFSKNSNPTTKNGVTYMSVTFKLSLPDLKTILTQEGLLKSQSGPITVLPLFVTSDDIQDILYGWWLPSDINEEADPKKLKFIKNQSLKLIKALQKSFPTNQFLFIDPIKQKSSYLVSKKFQKTRYKRKELMKLGDRLKAQILLIGRLRFYQGQLEQDSPQFQQNMLEIKLSAFDCASGKIVTELKKQHPTIDIIGQNSKETPKKNSIKKEKSTKSESKTTYASLDELYTHIVDKLTSQTLTAWQSGYFRLKHKKLTLLGQFTFQQLESFKQTIRKKLPSIKNLRERRFGTDQVVFEMESDIELKSLAEQLSQIDFNELYLTSPRVSKDNISFRVN